jgi:hypothetical protein
MAQQTLEEIKQLAERMWEGCHGCDETDKQMWTNGYITGALSNQIELPSDEEIEKKANNWCTVELDEDGFVRLHDYYDLYELPAFIAGAKWMRDKILNKQ